MLVDASAAGASQLQVQGNKTAGKSHNVAQKQESILDDSLN